MLPESMKIKEAIRAFEEARAKAEKTKMNKDMGAAVQSVRSIVAEAITLLGEMNRLYGLETGWQEARAEARLPPRSIRKRVKAPPGVGHRASDSIYMIIKEQPGLSGAKIVKAAKEKHKIGESTVRTSLHRLRRDGHIQEADGRWSVT